MKYHSDIRLMLPRNNFSNDGRPRVSNALQLPSPRRYYLDHDGWANSFCDCYMSVSISSFFLKKVLQLKAFKVNSLGTIPQIKY
jgi:hypothetical protein